MSDLIKTIVLGSISIAAAACTVGATGDASPDAGAPDVAAWETKNPHVEGASTHLWIVNRAVDILGNNRELPAASAAYALMTDRDCVGRWHQGLYDADYIAPYHGGNSDLTPDSSWWAIWRSGATWEAHFYDPDSKTNYKGNTSPVAKGSALEQLDVARAFLAAGNLSDGCYRLGLSLHYMTDITQPMHAANFAATDSPRLLHTRVEVYTMDIHARYARANWSGPGWGTPAQVIEDTAIASKALWPPLLNTIAAAGDDGCYFNVFRTSCWSGDARVDDQIGVTLRAAQQATARYLYSMNLTAP